MPGDLDVPGLRCERAVERYLAEVAVRLPGPTRTHSSIVAELHSGLLDATDTHRSAGLPCRAPLAAAIAGFGAVGADGLGLVLLAAELAAVPGKVSLLPAAAAAAASLARLLIASRAACRCLAMRASLTR